jgi:glutaminyl-tRNA synthetase
MSKRKIKKLIDEKFVGGWDDPRLYTLVALRRRGVPPGAILSFVNELGVTTANALVHVARFEQSIRHYLELTVPRLMLVLDPLPLVIEDFESLNSADLDIDIPFSPKNPEMGSHSVRLTKTVYIDRSDFREVDSEEYFRLAPGKTVGLWKLPFPVKATSFSKDAEGRVTEVKVAFDREKKKPKTYIQWVPEGSTKVECRVYDRLFRSNDPNTVEGGFLNDLNPNNATFYTGALVEPGFEEVRRRAPWPEAAGERGDCKPESVRFQAMRVAYFVSLHSWKL